MGAVRQFVLQYKKALKTIRAVLNARKLEPTAFRQQFDQVARKPSDLVRIVREQQ